MYRIPPEVADRPEGSALIYLSLGSLGSADVDLMRRLVDVLAATPHRYIVSKGPRHTEFDLAANMVGAEFLPQTTVIPQVDPVITHGGNNTTTECVHFGKPMILLPLFWDQYDNAQRMDETGFGVRLSTYGFTEAQMTAALEQDPAARHARAGQGCRRGGPSPRRPAPGGGRHRAGRSRPPGRSRVVTAVSLTGLAAAVAAADPDLVLPPGPRRSEVAARRATLLRRRPQVRWHDRRRRRRQSQPRPPRID